MFSTVAPLSAHERGWDDVGQNMNDKKVVVVVVVEKL